MRSHSLLPLLVVLALLAACTTDEVAAPQGLPDPGLSNVATENDAARADGVSIEGGMITATGSNGAVYTLTIPRDALDTSVTVAMYPIASMRNFPEGGSMAAGVHLEPEGLTFLAPATLTIELPSGIDPSNLVGTTSTGNGESYHAALATISGRTVTIPIAHFSQYHVGDPTLDRLLGPSGAGSLTLGQELQTELALTYVRFRDDGVDPSGEYLRILRKWYEEETKGEIAAYRSVTTASDAVYLDYHLTARYNDWLMAIDFCQATSPSFIDVDAEIADSKTRVAAALRNAVDLFEADCRQRAGSDPSGPPDAQLRTLAGASANALISHKMALRWGIAIAAHRLDLETILTGMCIRPVIEQRSLPSNLGPGGVGNLDVRAGVSVMGRPVRYTLPLTIQLSNFSPSIITPASGPVDASGRFSTSVQWPAGTNSLRIDMLATIPHSVFGLRDYTISVFDRITREVEPPDVISGDWRKTDHIWNYSDGPIHHGIFVKINAAGMLTAFRPRPGPNNTLMFELPIDVTGRRFTGTVDVPASQLQYLFAGWTIIVSGELKDDGSLQFDWNGGETDGARTVSGSDLLPPA